MNLPFSHTEMLMGAVMSGESGLWNGQALSRGELPLSLSLMLAAEEQRRYYGRLVQDPVNTLQGSWDETVSRVQRSWGDSQSRLAEISAAGPYRGAVMAGETAAEPMSLVLGAVGLFSRGSGIVQGVNQVGLTTRLNRTQLRDYLSRAHAIPREQLIKDLESVGLKLKGKGCGGEFMEFINKQGQVRVKIHPPD